MRRAVIVVCSALANLCAINAASADEPAMNEAAVLSVKSGDMIVQQRDGMWRAVKVLAVDNWGDGTQAAHCMSYAPTPTKPTPESLMGEKVHVWHVPINARTFRSGWQLIGNKSPSARELAGFHEYLKRTDFPRYLTVTGKDVDTIIAAANGHYKRANSLGNSGKPREALIEYDKAIELFPLFYEAIDNQAFTYMELGEFETALKAFEDSLRVNPNGVTAFFSRGECLLKLGHLERAEAVFEEGIVKFPEQRDLFARFREVVRSQRQIQSR